MPTSEDTGSGAGAPPAEIEERARQALAELGDRVASVTTLGVVGDVHVVSAVVQDGAEEVQFVVVVRPTSAEPSVQSLNIGTTSYEPGADMMAELTGFGELARRADIVLAEITMRESYAEYATDGDCQQRSQEPTTETVWALVCAPIECVAIKRKLSVRERGFEQNCAGRRTRTAAGPDPWELTVAVEDEDHVRLTRVAGTPPGPLGVVALGDLPREHVVRAD